jgi:hypothetical protein
MALERIYAELYEAIPGLEEVVRDEPRDWAIETIADIINDSE